MGVFPGEPAVSETGQGRVFIAGTEYPGLATARSFGDCTAKSVGVTAEPAIQVAQVLGTQCACFMGYKSTNTDAAAAAAAADGYKSTNTDAAAAAAGREATAADCCDR